MEKNHNENNSVQVKIADEVLKGTYATHVQIGHTAEEFVMDFMNVLPPAGIVNARVIVSPSHMKRLSKAILESIQKYEQQYGTISLAVVPDQKIGFRTE